MISGNRREMKFGGWAFGCVNRRFCVSDSRHFACSTVRANGGGVWGDWSRYEASGEKKKKKSVSI
jgi:hypothetical protein